MKNTVTLYTDGASRGNPGPGGWAAIIIAEDHVTELAGNPPAGGPATNNQMELVAVQKGLEYVREHFPDATVKLHADSTYVLKGLDSWLDGWKRNGWMTMAKKPVENKILWQELLDLRTYFGKKLELVKVAGHSGHEYNDRCDELAVNAALAKPLHLFSGTPSEYVQMLVDHPPVSVKKVASKSKEQKSGQKAYAYVSVVDGAVHSDSTWASCEARVKGKKGAKYKKVYSKDEEVSLMHTYRQLSE